MTSEVTLIDAFNFRNLDPLTTASITEIFQGVFVVAGHFARQVNFSVRYKILSLSPFSSFIDGFSAIRRAQKVRLNQFVPRSAIDEVLQVGWQYAAIYALVGCFALSSNLKLLFSGKYTSVAFGLNLMLLLFFTIQFTYSTRTVFRMLLAIWIVCWLMNALNASKKRKTEPIE